MFNSSEKTSFKYWFAHWSAFQMTALNHNAWKPKYLFHDFEKPILYALLPMAVVKNIHRKYADHHLTFHKGLEKIDWEALVLDWECSRFTKSDGPMNARETYWFNTTTKFDNGKIDLATKEALDKHVPPILNKFGL